MTKKRFNDERTEPEKPYSYIDDDCIIVECISGFIPTVIDGYSTIFACPQCDRHKQEIIHIKRYQGPVTKRSEWEMVKRLKERKDIYFNRKRSKIPTLEIEPF